MEREGEDGGLIHLQKGVSELREEVSFYVLARVAKGICCRSGHLTTNRVFRFLEGWEFKMRSFFLYPHVAERTLAFSSFDDPV